MTTDKTRIFFLYVTKDGGRKSVMSRDARTALSSWKRILELNPIWGLWLEYSDITHDVTVVKIHGKP